MANFHKDKQYMSICSEKTLQSNDKGFFLTFADQVAETVGEKWINGVFAKSKNDADRIRLIYEDETCKKVVCGVLSHVQEIYRKKSSEISQSRRVEAEKAFHGGDLVKALTLYSQSVLRAQPTGQNTKVDAGLTLALALWGRSKVLFASDEFSLALTDIQMAFKENLPESYKGEAFWKMTLCYKALDQHDKSKVCWNLTKKLHDKSKLPLLEEDLKKSYVQAKKSTRKILPAITGNAHEVFKSASKKISVRHSKDKGRFVVANENIKTGETLVVEPPYAACLLPECFGTHCHHCFERLINPVGCPSCSNVAFCNQTCRDEALTTYHQYECKFLDLLIGSGMSILSHTALRAVTQKTLQETLDVYKDTSKEMVYSLCTLSKLRPPKDFLQRTLMAAFLLRCLQKSGFFGKKDTNRVVPDDDEYKIGELLLFHLQMLQFNAHEIYETRHGVDHRFRNAKAAYIGVAVYPTVALFNHDCYPAVTRYFVGKNIVINAVRPLKPNDVIAENYGPIFTRKTLAERQRSLSSRYWFECKCLACKQNWPSLDTGLDNIAKLLRCPNKKCPNTFTLPLQNDAITCPKCNKKSSMKEALVKLEKCEENYGKAFEFLDQQKPEKALEILCETIDTFHSISSPPHRDTHLAQEILRACMADSGNVYECLIKM